MMQVARCVFTASRARCRFQRVQHCLGLSLPLQQKRLHGNDGGGRSPYEVLGISTKANSEEIRKAYFTLAKNCHPDVYDAVDARARFQEISDAYALLINEQLRSSHDLQAGIYQSGETSAKDLFDRVFRDQRHVNPILAVQERALHAIMEAKKGNERPLTDFVIDYRLPPQLFLPPKPQLEAVPGSSQSEVDVADERGNTINDLLSKSPISGGA